MSEFWVVCFGILCFSVTATLFAYFIRSKQRIGRAVAYMLAGEAVGLFVTIIFAITSKGVFGILPAGFAMVMRVVVFSVAMFSSLHLAYATAKIQVAETAEGE